MNAPTKPNLCTEPVQSTPILAQALVIERLYGAAHNTVHVSMHEIEIVNFTEEFA